MHQADLYQTWWRKTDMKNIQFLHYSFKAAYFNHIIFPVHCILGVNYGKSSFEMLGKMYLYKLTSCPFVCIKPLILSAATPWGFFEGRLRMIITTKKNKMATNVLEINELYILTNHRWRKYVPRTSFIGAHYTTATQSVNVW